MTTRSVHLVNVWCLQVVFHVKRMLSVFLKSLTPEGTANPWYWDFQFVGLTTFNVVFSEFAKKNLGVSSGLRCFL